MVHWIPSLHKRQKISYLSLHTHVTLPLKIWKKSHKLSTPQRLSPLLTTSRSLSSINSQNVSHNSAEKPQIASLPLTHNPQKPSFSSSSQTHHRPRTLAEPPSSTVNKPFSPSSSSSQQSLHRHWKLQPTIIAVKTTELKPSPHILRLPTGETA